MSFARRPRAKVRCFDRGRISGGNDEELTSRRQIGLTEYRRGDETLAFPSVLLCEMPR
jgi:hypothetical protein